MRAAVLIVVVVVCCWETSAQDAAPDVDFINIAPGIEYAVPLPTSQGESSTSGDENDEESNTEPDSSEGDEDEVSSTSAPPAQGGNYTHPPYALWRSKHRCNKTNTEKKLDWHAKFENLTGEQKMELMHKHRALYANLTEEVLSFVNITYHQMLQLPPRGDKANATLCLQRARFVKDFLHTLHKMIKPFMPNGGGHGWNGRGERGGDGKRGGDAKRGKTWSPSAGHGDDGLSSQIKDAIENAVSDLLKDRTFQSNVRQMVSASMLGQKTNSTLQVPNDKAGWGLGGKGQYSKDYRGRDQGGQGPRGRGQGDQGHGGKGQGDQGHGGRGQGGQGHGGMGQGGQGHGGRGQGGQGHADRGQGSRGQSGQGHGDRRQGSQGQDNRGHAHGDTPSVGETTESRPQQSN